MPEEQNEEEKRNLEIQNTAEREVSIKSIIINMAVIWAYEEYARSQRLKGVPMYTPLDEIVNDLWEQLKRSEKPGRMNEEYKKLFQFLFEKEFRTFYALLEDGENDMLDRMELVFEKVGYEPQLRVIRK